MRNDKASHPGGATAFRTTDERPARRGGPAEVSTAPASPIYTRARERVRTVALLGQALIRATVSRTPRGLMPSIPSPNPVADRGGAQVRGGPQSAAKRGSARHRNIAETPGKSGELQSRTARLKWSRLLSAVNSLGAVKATA
jgi:hypothetical protein